MSNKFLYVLGTMVAKTDDAVLLDVIEFEDMRGTLHKGGGEHWFPWLRMDYPDPNDVEYKGEEVEISVEGWILVDRGLI